MGDFTLKLSRLLGVRVCALKGPPDQAHGNRTPHYLKFLLLSVIFIFKSLYTLLQTLKIEAGYFTLFD